jgi:hypothetical protein
MVVSNSILYVVVNEIWYPLITSLTKTRYVFDKWWSESLVQDVLLFVNGTADLFEWDGGFALISTTTNNTIVLDRTVILSNLPASGSVIINGTTYTYSGSSGSTLTGVSADPSGEPAGSGVLQPVTTHSTIYSATFTPDFLRVVNNQLYLGSYTSRLVPISSQSDITNYTVPTPRLSGSPELITLDGTADGIGIRQGNACIGYGTNGWAIISFSDVTVGTVLTNVTTRTLKPVAVLQAPLAHEFIDMVGDNLIYLGQDHQVREFGDFNNAFVPVYPSLSQEVARELTQETFTGGCLKCISEFIYITAPTSGKTYLRQERTKVDANGTVVSEKLWHPPFIWNATSIDQIDGVVVAFSNANPQIYEVWDTGQWHDDSPSDEPLPYSCIMALGYRGEQRRQGLWSFDKAYSEGYIVPGTALTLLINYNYQGATSSVKVPINSISQPVYTLASSLASLGENSLGDEPLGQGGIADTANDQDSLPKFKCINSLALTNVFEWQPVYYSDQADAQWEILASAVNATVDPDQNASFIINKKK